MDTMVKQGNVIRVIFQRWDLSAVNHIPNDKLNDPETLQSIAEQAESAFRIEITKRYEALTQGDESERVSGEEDSPDRRGFHSV
jgi:hypothetical protein